MLFTYEIFKFALLLFMTIDTKHTFISSVSCHHAETIYC